MLHQEKSSVTVLIPAAGEGRRMGGRRKQYRELGGAPLLLRTLEPFGRHPLVSAIVVAAPKEDVASVERQIHVHGIATPCTIVAGGSTRQASVAAALEAADDRSDVILVHDAVRPFVSADSITAVVEAAQRFGAAALAFPATDTLRRVDGERFGATVDRRGLFRMQTPQAFRRDWFVEAHRIARSDDVEETDDVALVQRAGRSVVPVEGRPDNIKVTTPADWELAQILWAARCEADEGSA